jgi:hypothetical protein
LKPLLSFVLFFLFLSAQYTTHTTQGFVGNIISEKTTETEKEEKRIEEETKESLNGENCFVGKTKKYKKQAFPPEPVVLQEIIGNKKIFISFLSDLSESGEQFIRYNTPTAFAVTPRYVVFHSLIFYEKV